jgi:hypothetical protein
MSLNSTTQKRMAFLGGNKSYSGTNAQFKDHILYDTLPFVVYTSISGPVQFFTTPSGGVQYGLTKTDVETNMNEQGKLSAGQQFLVESFSFSHIRNTDTSEFESAKTAALARVLQGSRFRIVMPGRQFEFEIPGARLLPPTFTRQDNVAAQATAVSAAGDFIGPNQIVLQTPIPLTDSNGAPVNFKVEQLINTSDVGVQGALAILAAAGTNGADRLQIRLGGAMFNLL